MREKLKEFQNSPCSIIAVFSAAVLFFCTVFTRLILKTDDGHFLGILHRDVHAHRLRSDVFFTFRE